MQEFLPGFGIYVHVPFCVRKCSYCRFYKSNPSVGDIDFYISSIASELGLEIERAERSGKALRKPDTMFWGGGTPSMLSEPSIERLALALKPLWPSGEWTVEVAPQTITPSKLSLLKSLGVDRISMGVQSFNPKTLKSLGRDYPAQAALKSVELVADAGFAKFGIDLIFGADGQSKGEWLDDLRQAVALPVNHISAYCLEYESGTSCCGGGRLSDSAYNKAAREAELFEAAMDFLPANGFPQYEVSNYARNGAECVHNISTWKMGEWLGFGPSAASQFSGVRRKNPASLEDWGKIVAGNSAAYEDVVKLDDSEMFVSALIFGLRMRSGIDFSELCGRFPAARHLEKLNILKDMQSYGLVDISGERIRLTRAGILVADAVAVELI